MLDHFSQHSNNKKSASHSTIGAADVTFISVSTGTLNVPEDSNNPNGYDSDSFDRNDFESIQKYLGKFSINLSGGEEISLWIPRDPADWGWHLELSEYAPPTYEAYVEKMEAVAETFRKAGCEVKIVTASIPAIRQMIYDAGLKCDDTVSRIRALFSVTGSPFVQMEEDLMEAGLRAGFPPDDDAPLGRPTMHDT